jgi:hypothetical protein
LSYVTTSTEEDGYTVPNTKVGQGVAGTFTLARRRITTDAVLVQNFGSFLSGCSERR